MGQLTFDIRLSGPADGPPVMLLHGFPQTSEVWDRVGQRLSAAGYRVIAPDQRGYSAGASPPEVDAYRMPELVADVIGLLDALHLTTAHLVGHDWGGAVAWQVAARHPDRLRTVTVVSTPHPLALGRDLQTSREAKLRFGYATFLRLRGSERVLGAADGWLLRRWLGLMGLRLAGRPPGTGAVLDPARLRTALHWYRAFSGHALKGLPPMTVPTLYVFGRHEPAFTIDAARATARHCDGPYTYREIADGGHWLPQTHADVLADELSSHLTAQSG